MTIIAKAHKNGLQHMSKQKSEGVLLCQVLILSLFDLGKSEGGGSQEGPGKASQVRVYNILTNSKIIRNTALRY